MTIAYAARRLVTTGVAATALLALTAMAACASILGIDPVSYEPASEAGTEDALVDAPAALDSGLEASQADAPLPPASCVPCGGDADPCGIVCDAPTGSEFLEVGNGFVFFGSRTKLERIGLDGLGRTTIATGDIGGFAFHPPSSTIAWTIPSTDTIMIRFANGNPAVEKSFTVPSFRGMHAKHVVLTSTRVVYFEGGDQGFAGGRGLACDTLAANCDTPLQVFVGGDSEEVVSAAQALGDGGTLGWRTRGVSLDAGSAYVTSGTNPAAFARVKSGLPTMPFMPLAVGADGVAYWSELGGTTNNVFAASLANPAPVLAFDAGAEPVASIAAGPGVYVTEPGARPLDYAGKIVRINGPSLYANRPNPGRIIHDSTGIYWIDRGNPSATPSLVMRGKP